MKKFTELTEKNSNKDFENKILSSDIEDVDKHLEDEIDETKLDGSWEIVSIVDVTTEMPDLNESNAIVINADFGSREVKRGEYVYITAQIKKAGQSQAYHHSKMGVIKCRIVDIYNTMTVLNTLR